MSETTRRTDRCETCRFWDRGFCRRYPPTAATIQVPDDDVLHDIAQRVETGPSEWCGEWRGKEEE